MQTELSEACCHERQASFTERLAALNVEAALLTDARHLMYLFNYHDRSIYPAAALVLNDGSSILARAAHLSGSVQAGLVVGYHSSNLSTLGDDLETLALEPLLPHLGSVSRLAVDTPTRPWLFSKAKLVAVGELVRAMRRRKWPDEIAVLSAAVGATEAGYAAVKPAIRPDVLEIEVFARFQQAAVVALGEPIGELGNDFRGGAMGGSPRGVPLKAGDLLPIDAGVVCRHYNADLCRTFAVSGARTSAQQVATDRVIRALEIAEEEIRPGLPCRILFQRIHSELDGFRGWRFPHHLGHGIGLDPHEAPRINPHWGDIFAVGDVFTLEPGLYGEELFAGVRIEQNYWLTEAGLKRLSSFELAP